MRRFVQGEDRTQGTFLPQPLDDYVTENNPVRVIDVFVDQLDLGKLGFEGVEAEITRPHGLPARRDRSAAGAVQELDHYGLSSLLDTLRKR